MATRNKPEGDAEGLPPAIEDGSAAVTIVRATSDNPMPSPPHGGRWARQKNGDLHLVESTRYPTAEERSAARRASQAAAAHKNPAKE